MVGEASAATRARFRALEHALYGETRTFILGRRANADADGVGVDGDKVLVTAGPWLADLAAQVHPSCPIVLAVAIAAPPRPAWNRMPIVLDDVASRGRGFYAVPPVAGLPLKIGDHAVSRTDHPDRGRAPAADECARILDLARRRHGGALRLLHARGCF
jgi:sarcosine oxidase subunit beta